MAAVSFSSTQVANANRIVIQGKQRGYTPAQTIACLSTAIQESMLDESAVSPNGAWVGVYQQDSGYPDRYTAEGNINGFFHRLDAKRNSPGWSPDIWKDIFWLQQRPGEASADAAYANGRQAYLTEIQSRTADATALYNQLAQGNPVADRPDFNEYPLWSSNNQDRAGTPIDLFLLHTEEGNMNADALARWMDTQEVSYHYTISEDPNDHGITVCDVVDTDLASWSVLDSNDRSINLCFAGSYAAWTRADWLSKFPKAIDVAAYLAVQDCQKYGIPLNVIPPPYNADPPGISDHRYCTEHLKDGNTHTDVGDGFPWDVFAAAVNKYAGITPAPAPAPVPAPAGPPDYQVLTYEQLAGPRQDDGYGHGWDQLGGKTVVDTLAGMQTQLNNMTAMIAALMTQPKTTTRFRWFHRKAK
jgi:N-acetyl-anhydromuramyl-L-alanine amidase AmpD